MTKFLRRFFINKQTLIIEYSTTQTASFSLFFLFLYLLLLSFKAWVITSLGKFWNTKIYHISGLPLIKNGVYKYVKHPNYMVVIAEIAIIPLVFHLYYTAIAFTVFNAIMLSVRVNEENKVLKI
jgi:methyltransferase